MPTRTVTLGGKTWRVLPSGRVTPNDRWAIVEYIRALQRSQNAKLDDVPVAERERLEAAR